MNRPEILLLPGVAAIGDLPIHPAIQVLLDDHVHRLFLVIAQLDLERFGDDVSVIVGVEAGLPPLADDVEGAAELDHHVLVLGGVMNDVPRR